MQPRTEGHEEHGPSGVPFINDPEKPTSPPLNDADATDAAEAEEDIEDDGKTVSVKVHKADGTLEEERTYPRSADPRRTMG